MFCVISVQDYGASEGGAGVGKANDAAPATFGNLINYSV